MMHLSLECGNVFSQWIVKHLTSHIFDENYLTDIHVHMNVMIRLLNITLFESLLIKKQQGFFFLFTLVS